MASVNKITLIGNVGKEPEIRQTTTGINVASFSLATSETYQDKNSGEKKTRTEWHTIVAYDKKADFVEEYINKGSKIYVEGPVRYREYTNQKGEKKRITEIEMRVVVLLDSKNNAGKDEESSMKVNVDFDNPQTDIDDDNIPF